MSAFHKDCLDAHNEYRSKHNAPPLELNQQLCDYAQQWADNLARRDQMYHRQPNKYGENCYMSWSSSSPSQGVPQDEGRKAVKMWYSEISKYVFGRGQFSAATGHFTQVVWKSSRCLGVGAARSASGKIYIVANYDPPGNYQGQFAANVLPPAN